MKIQRWRITFAKTEAMRFTGHLDLILTWERTFRRSGLPLSYSEGFNPRPVINLAAPLPLGFTSEGEMGDFWLSETVPEEEFSNSLQGALPPGLQIKEIQLQDEVHGKKLPSLVTSALYLARIPGSQPALPSQIDSLLQANTLIRERKGKTYDIRPLIQDLFLGKTSENEPLSLTMRLSLLPGATGRPDEVLAALGISPHQAAISREKIYLQNGPLPG